MVKLNKSKIKWLVKQVCRNGRLPSEVAKVYDLNTRRVQQLVKYYKDTGEFLLLNKQRRPKTSLPDYQKERVFRNKLPPESILELFYKGIEHETKK